MPPNPAHIDETVVLSDDYHETPIVVEFYTNNAMAIRRGEDETTMNRVWFDNLEKRALKSTLNSEVNDE